ncbi:MAG: DUF3365 domain-containing protein [Sulfurimonas sp.]
MSYKARFINRVVYMIVVIWSIIMLIAGFVSVKENYKYADKSAKHEALVSVKKDLAYRSWVASHGGVYVPITKRTPPNPYLSNIKNRDVNTTDGQQLTLMNPAYTLTEMMRDYSHLYGTKGHITSRILMNPKNKPDVWEDQALQTAEIAGLSSETKSFINGEEYYRYLRPLVTQESCLKCHAFQGYKIGDIRGGVSVSIPMKEYYREAFEHSSVDVSIIVLLYILGLLVIFYGKKEAKKILETKIKDYEQHIFSLVDILEKRDSYTAGHTKRVGKYASLIAKEMGFNQEVLDDLHRACMLHDIGKISTPDAILLKPGRLNKLEYEIIKEHVVVSYELLKNVDIYKDIAEIVRHHHEHYDGSGYPKGIKGDNVPMMSQVMTLADSFDAMTTNRIYKGRKNVVTALVEIKTLSGKQFNPLVVKAALVALKNLEIDTNISQLPKTKIEKARFAYFYKDQVTNIFNKDYLEFVLTYNHLSEFNLKCLYHINLHNFTQYNKKYNWEKGDVLLGTFAKVLEDINKDDFVFRMNGDNFIILNKEHFEIEKYLVQLEDVLEGTDVHMSYKHFELNDINIQSLKDLETLV